ncbi:hypothetical protein ACFQB0_01545 [Luethyella okanaganae]|uniref:Glycosyltransferase RgtA/B/C/D-like domain-containing protein n=1 Tax=Luethyella okanaganae TaxID=69372 RepID=A0ABW1VAN6_9MICO
MPRAIRSDEWLVQQAWVVSQANSGYPALNDHFPGGIDMTVFNELPTWEWSSIFRPHVWGYLFFGLTTGVAWHWWLPALALVCAVYFLVVALAPRRPLVAAALAGATFLAPFVQWWYTPTTLWAVAWSVLAMAGTTWILTDRRRWVRYVWASVLGYTAVTMAMTLYIPFLLPGILVYLGFAVGMLLRVAPWRDGGLLGSIVRLGPLLVAGAAAVTVLGIWVLTRAATFEAVLSTVYPGQRFEATGQLLVRDPLFVGFAGAPWNQALRALGPTMLGGNPSEAASVLLVALFLLPAMLWFAVRSIRQGRRPEWLLITVPAVMLLFLAFLYIPGWDSLAHVLQLDRVPAERFRIAFVVLLPLSIALIIEHIDRFPKRSNWAVGGVCALGAAALSVFVWLQLRSGDPGVVGFSRQWKIIMILLVLGVFLIFVKRLAFAGALALFLASGLTGWGVNPIYHGVYDLRETRTGQTVGKVDRHDPGTWVGVGSSEVMAILTETGVTSLTGVQNYPPDGMWDEIDPAGNYEGQWNRLGHVTWTFESGEPQVSNPYADVILVTFDACSSFAQANVDFVLTDIDAVPDTRCLSEQGEVRQGGSTMRVYSVEPPG